MKSINVNEAQERLPELLDEGAQGKEIIITKGDGASYRVTVEVLAPGSVSNRTPDLHPGSFEMSDDFDEALPDAFWLGDE